MNIAVVTPCLVQGDAVSNDVLSMVAALNRLGHSARPSSPFIKDGIDAVPLARLSSFLQSPDDVLIYHHSIGTEECVQFYESVPCRKIVKYHNITPPEFYEIDNKEVGKICRIGLEQTSRLLPHCSGFWVDSAFNGREMQVKHPEQPFPVLPPFNQVDRLIEAEPDLTAVALYDDWMSNILVVGRLVPNKNNLLAVDAFEEYRTRFDPHSRLIFVGDLAPGAPIAIAWSNTFANGISAGMSSSPTKSRFGNSKTLFLTAQMLLTTSSHEGFCLPLAEAMGLRVPIVALPNTAIPETAGEAAWYAEPAAEQIAVVMNDVRTQPVEREQRLNRGWARYQKLYRNDVIERQFLRLFEGATANSLFVASRAASAAG